MKKDQKILGIMMKDNQNFYVHHYLEQWKNLCNIPGKLNPEEPFKLEGVKVINFKPEFRPLKNWKYKKNKEGSYTLVYTKIPLTYYWHLLKFKVSQLFLGVFSGKKKT